MFCTPFSRCAPLVAPLVQTLRPRPLSAVLSSPKNIVAYRLYRGIPQRRLQYQRFGAGGPNFWQRWAGRSTFYYEVAAVGGVGGALYVYNLETVPVSGRRRFNCISPATEEATAKQFFEEIMQEYQDQILSQWDPRTRRVQRVLDRLIPASGLTGENWEVHVIDSPERNAFVIPGGKVFVFSGILPICQNEDGIAAVLGHEIAHNVAHHSAERMSQSFVLLALVQIAAFFYGVPASFGSLISEIAFSRPGSRMQEAEADYIGLMMMAQSCYNPEAAVGLWERMAMAERGGPPQFLSTHPSNYNRQQKIKEWLPEAMEKLEMSDCHGVSAYADDFKRAFSQIR
ncbi:hypothetical protein K432DRAFT_384901 [Lepidopterella palustris CBS 459.81]|uniref:Peptidase M48 domain-containing protein n=1 Tax=Lepidopterella palustris CBS 459.81 TaxID=1314670 RepID=A0A8E2E4I3_9PEZI|nr:hypothetical protein K432DRAFT_384901 [Lepidopterella palustris CBS 459.81]